MKTVDILQEFVEKNILDRINYPIPVCSSLWAAESEIIVLLDVWYCIFHPEEYHEEGIKRMSWQEYYKFTRDTYQNYNGGIEIPECQYKPFYSFLNESEWKEKFREFVLSFMNKYRKNNDISYVEELEST